MLSISNSSIQSVEQWLVVTMPGFIIFMHLINYLLGLPLNSYVIALLLRGRRSLDPCDVFVLNQAAAEIFFMLFAPFHILLSVTLETRYCPPVGFFLGIGMGVRATLQCLVCLERYVAVLHPVTFLKLRPLRYRVAACVATWTGGLAVGVLCMMAYPSMPYQVFGVIYFIYLSISAFCCVSILMALRHPGPGERNADRRTEDGAKKRAFQVVVMNLLTFLVQNTPIAVLFGILYTLPPTRFKMGTIVCLAINLTMSYAQPVFVLRKAGKIM